MASYSINAETVMEMMTYTNLTPEILDEITNAITTLMTAFEDDWKNLVGDHVVAYKELLHECKGLMQVIASDVTETSDKILVKAKKYSEILSQKIR